MKTTTPRALLALLLGLVAICLGTASRALALENSVRVESKSVRAGAQDARISIFVNTADYLNALFLPLEIRTADGGAFIAGGSTLVVNPDGRMDNGGFIHGGCYPEDPVFTRQFPGPDSVNYCSGPSSNSYSNPGGVDLSSTSPDANFMQIVADCSLLPPGTDPSNPDSASLLLYFDVLAKPGQFVIDTCCTISRHLYYGYVIGPSVTPEFTPGIVTVLPPCGCPCQADPECDGMTNMLDVVLVIDRAFRGAAATIHSSCIDSSGTDGLTDVDCSQTTDALDVVKIIDVALRGADAEVNFCFPCGQPFFSLIRP